MKSIEDLFPKDLLIKDVKDETETIKTIEQQIFRDDLICQVDKKEKKIYDFLRFKTAQSFGRDIWNFIIRKECQGSVLSRIFMVELKKTLVPTLLNHLKSWKRYVDGRNFFIKEDSIEHVLSVLNGFHPFIQFTHETESNNRLSFLDVLIIRNGQSIETCVNRKLTNKNIHIH